MEGEGVDIIDFLDGPASPPPPSPGHSTSKVPPELPMKPKSKITIFIDIPHQSVFHKEVKLLPTLTSSQVISKLQGKKILSEDVTVGTAWHITHVPKKFPMETQDLTADTTIIDSCLWEIGVRDQDLLIFSCDQSLPTGTDSSTCPPSSYSTKKKEKESLLDRFKKTLRGSSASMMSVKLDDEHTNCSTLSSGSPPSLGLLFRVPLDVVSGLGPPLMSSAHFGVPQFIESAFEYLQGEERGTEGIFRLSGSSAAIKSYKKIIDNGGQIEWKAGHDAHNATGLIKMYIRELPEPLLTFKLFDVFYAVSTLTVGDANQVVSLLKVVLRALPRCNYNLLKFIVQGLEQLSRNEEETKMGISNLATLIGPNIAKPSEADTCEDQQEMFQITSKASAIVGCLLTHCEHLYSSAAVSGYPPKASDEGESSYKASDEGESSYKASDEGESSYKAIAMAAFDYEIKESDELALTDGQPIFITSLSSEDDWWEGSVISNGCFQIGRFPRNYVEILHSFNDAASDSVGDTANDFGNSATSGTAAVNEKDDGMEEGNVENENSSANTEEESPKSIDVFQFADSTAMSSDKLTPSALFETRMAQLEAQIVELKMELKEERSQRENLAKIIPTLMKNQDEVLNLLHNLSQPRPDPEDSKGL